MAKKKQLPEEVAHSEAYVKDFFDMAVPSAIRFNVDHFICGDSYRSVWAIREYPPQTSDQALLARFGDKEAVTVHLYTRLVDGVEQRKILQNASRKNKLLANSNDLEDSVTGEGNLGDVVELLGELRKNREPLLHCAVFIELSAGNLDKLRELQSDVSMEMTREKISVDHLSMRQKEGFIACMPCGYNIFGTQYERVLPASAVANLFPFNYSGKTDKNGFYLGKDKFGTNIIADFDQRADDKTNSNVLILGNSGQGKSYLLKLILVNLRMSGKSVISLDAEQEYKDLCDNLGGCYVDLMIGEYIINPLEPKEWSDNGGEADADSPEAFRKATRLSQHISYLKDFFRVYKDFDDAQIDALEILLSRLYAKFGITDNTDYDKLKADDYPVMADLYAMVESEYQRHEKGSKSLFTEDLLRELCLGLNSMCVGAESKFFNGHTNISMRASPKPNPKASVRISHGANAKTSRKERSLYNSVDCFKCLSGITVINLKKTQLNVLPELVKEIENLRTNDFVRRSNTLHLKQSKINMVTLFVLLQDYSQEDLINLIPRIPAYIDRDFYTISYLKRLLKKAMKGDTI